jgi:MFS family permease
VLPREKSIECKTDKSASARRFPGQLARARQRIWLLFSALSYRDFRLLWLGRNLSRLGDSVYEVALGWTVYKVTGSSMAMGVIVGTFTTLQVALALFGGALGDRMSRRYLLLVTDATAMMITALLALATAAGQVSFLLLLVVAAGLGVTSALSLPSLGPLIGELVPRHELQNANALDSATFSLMTLVGPALGGFIVSYSIAVAFGFDALTFLLSFLAMLLMRRIRSSISFQRVRYQDLIAGFKYIGQRPWLKWLIAVSIAANVACIAPFYVLLPLRIANLHLSASIYGLALAAQGASSVLASASLAYLRRVRQTGALLFVSMAGPGVACLLLAVAHSLVTIVCAGAVMGVNVYAVTLINYLLQRYVAPDYQSRVTSILLVGSLVFLPAAYAGMGILASYLPAPLVLAAGGMVLLLVCAVALGSPAGRGLQGLDQESQAEVL